MNKTPCSLCGTTTKLMESHIIPSFVTREIKNDSVTGYLRDLRQINKRVQDGDKLPMLCFECEQRFSKPEGQVAESIFQGFHKNDVTTFTYGPWLHYFLASLAWRTLVLDMPYLLEDERVDSATKAVLTNSETSLRAYLLSQATLDTSIECHVVMCATFEKCPDAIRDAGPSVLVRRSTFGYTLYSCAEKCACVVVNLAGMFCVTMLSRHPKDVWRNTLVEPVNGAISKAPVISSWIALDVMEYLLENREKMNTGLSDAQQQKIIQSALASKEFKSIRIFEADDRAKSS